MSEQIWKFRIPIEAEFVLSMPEHAVVLSVQTQDGLPFLWAICDLEASREDRGFVLRGTGHDLPLFRGRHLGTFQMEGRQLMFHLFEAKP